MRTQAPPAKLFVEPTTLCNLKCRMCVKQSQGNGIVEGFLEQERFAALSKILPYLDSVVFSGIGEPLLHPDLEKFVTSARSRLPSGSWIGLQTNGHLMDDRRAVDLVRAGLNRICISMDAASSRTLRLNRCGAEMAHVESAIQAVRRARETPGAVKVKLGIEYVLMRNNLAELPRAIEQAALNGADFAIVSQMLPYSETVMPETLYTANTDASIRFFQKWQVKARSRGLDLKKYVSVRWKYIRSADEQELIDFVEAMISGAAERQIPFHFRKLLMFDEALARQVESVFAQARDCAARHSLVLKLPALHPRFKRECEFVQNRSVFLAWDGRIYPCYMLWHQYKCYFDGREKPISFEPFGRIPEQDILDIWDARPYRDFRQEVTNYDFPYCSNCNVGPCDLITNTGFEYDCFTMEVPCGDCPWCMGLMQCLQ
ncbi:MAG: radical SAM/SPASM family putative metalloenzyme maturase [Desulfobacterales bacterium]|nr:radical SAM/SPASM family putative metalloenzyme maturase [Desulfobacterales bacterium]